MGEIRQPHITKSEKRSVVQFWVHSHLLVCLFFSCCQTLQNGDSSNAYLVHGHPNTDTQATTNEREQLAVFAFN